MASRNTKILARKHRALRTGSIVQITGGEVGFNREQRRQFKKDFSVSDSELSPILHDLAGASYSGSGVPATQKRRIRAWDRIKNLFRSDI